MVSALNNLFNKEFTDLGIYNYKVVGPIYIYIYIA